MMNTILEAALRWLDQGIAVIPIAYRSKLPDANALKWTGYQDNGHASWIHFQSALPTETEVKTWTNGPRINLAVVTGWQGLVILDFDSCNAWDLYQEWLEDNPLAKLVAETTYRVATGRGMHLYVSVEEPVRNGHVGVIDIKAAGGYVLTPPSVHPTGRTYGAIDPTAPVLCVERLADIFPLQMEDDPIIGPDVLTPPLTEHRRSVVTADDPLDAADTTPTVNLVAQVKLAYRLEDWFRDLTPSGRGWFLTRCPLHDDSNPSFWVDTNRQLCGCYAGCTTRPLDVINLYARTHNLTNNQALLELATRMR